MDLNIAIVYVPITLASVSVAFDVYVVVDVVITNEDVAIAVVEIVTADINYKRNNTELLRKLPIDPGMAD